MKEGIHPEYHKINAQCACGNEIELGSVDKEIRTEICSACHPFFTGEQRFVDTAGRVDKFAKRYGDSKARRLKAPKLSDLNA